MVAVEVRSQKILLCELMKQDRHVKYREIEASQVNSMNKHQQDIARTFHHKKYLFVLDPILSDKPSIEGSCRQVRRNIEKNMFKMYQMLCIIYKQVTNHRSMHMKLKQKIYCMGQRRVKSNKSYWRKRQISQLLHIDETKEFLTCKNLELMGHPSYSLDFTLTAFLLFPGIKSYSIFRQPNNRLMH